MDNHEHLPPVEGEHNPCFNCPTIPTQAAMDKIILVGFGEATVRRNGVVVLDCERDWEEERYPTFEDAEDLAAADPGDDWRVILNGPMHGETYQRQGERVWILVERNEGFA